MLLVANKRKNSDIVLGGEFKCKDCGTSLIRKSSSHVVCADCRKKRKKVQSDQKRAKKRKLKVESPYIDQKTVPTAKRKTLIETKEKEVIETSVSYKLANNKIPKNVAEDKENYCLRFGGYFSDSTLSKVRLMKASFVRMCDASFIPPKDSLDKFTNVHKHPDSFICANCSLGKRRHINKEDVYPVNVDWIDEESVKIVKEPA